MLCTYCLCYEPLRSWVLPFTFLVKFSQWVEHLACTFYLWFIFTTQIKKNTNTVSWNLPRYFRRRYFQYHYILLSYYTISKNFHNRGKGVEDQSKAIYMQKTMQGHVINLYQYLHMTLGKLYRTSVYLFMHNTFELNDK